MVINRNHMTPPFIKPKLFLLLLIAPLFNCIHKVENNSTNTIAENTVAKSLNYLNQNPPSMIPEIFAPGLISSKTHQEFGSVFSKDGKEFFYGVKVNDKTAIRYTKLMGDHWSDPKTILAHELYNYGDPFLSPDEKKLFFISERSMDGTYNKGNYDIWYVNKLADGWSAPINAGPNINSEGNEFYISFNNQGTLYFSFNKDIHYSKSINGVFQKAISLGDSINTPQYEADAFVDPNEAYIIFCSVRTDGFGAGDLYISFKKSDGSWTKAKNMGELINSESHEFCPFVTKDGKYLFYATKGDIYWVDAKIIERYNIQ